jgi:hypothetical protein
MESLYKVYNICHTVLKTKYLLPKEIEGTWLWNYFSINLKFKFKKLIYQNSQLIYFVEALWKTDLIEMKYDKPYSLERSSLEVRIQLGLKYLAFKKKRFTLISLMKTSLRSIRTWNTNIDKNVEKKMSAINDEIIKCGQINNYNEIDFMFREFVEESQLWLKKLNL